MYIFTPITFLRANFHIIETGKIKFKGNSVMKGTDKCLNLNKYMFT